MEPLSSRANYELRHVLYEWRGANPIAARMETNVGGGRFCNYLVNTCVLAGNSPLSCRT